jgi:tetratricopeptide (TPR) repeat protein
LLENYPGEIPEMTARKLAASTNPFMRLSAARVLGHYPSENYQVLYELITDTIRAIRFEAARALSVLNMDEVERPFRLDHSRRMNEYINSLLSNTENIASHIELTNYFLGQGLEKKARVSLARALESDPDYWFILKQMSKIDEVFFADFISQYPNSPSLLFNYGLFLMGSDQAGGLEMLERAAEESPENREYSIVYARALISGGKIKEANNVLEGLFEKDWTDLEVVLQLKNNYKRLNEPELERKYLLIFQLLAPWYKETVI